MLRARDGRTVIEQSGVTVETDEPFGRCVAAADGRFSARHTCRELPRFTGGAGGYLAYDAVPWFELVSLQPPGVDANGPEPAPASFMLFDTVLAFDHVQHRILIIANARVSRGDNLQALYQFACAKIQFLERELERELSRPEPPSCKSLEVRSNVTREDFEASVRAAREHIAAGDIYQVVLSQRFETRITSDPFTVYRALRHVNPSLTCSSFAWVRSPFWALRPRCWSGSKAGTSRPTRSPARGHAGGMTRRICSWQKSSRATRRSERSM